MAQKLYTAKDVERCYPWISSGTTNYRVKTGAIPLAHPSSGSGIPNLFTLPELVHCAVVDELASVGVFGNLHATSIIVRDTWLEQKTGEIGRATLVKQLSNFDPEFYEKWDYWVMVELEIHHALGEAHRGLVEASDRELLKNQGRSDADIDFLYGLNGTQEKGRQLSRLCSVTYYPVKEPNFKSWLESLWLTYTGEGVAGFTPATKAYIRVRQLYNWAAVALGLPKR